MEKDKDGTASTHPPSPLAVLTGSSEFSLAGELGRGELASVHPRALLVRRACVLVEDGRNSVICPLHTVPDLVCRMDC